MRLQLLGDPQLMAELRVVRAHRSSPVPDADLVHNGAC